MNGKILSAGGRKGTPGFEAGTPIIQTRDLGFEILKQSPSQLGLPNPEVFDQSK
jgi:hypothetical protein